MHAAAVRRVFEQGSSVHERRVVLFVAPGQGGAAIVATRRIGGAVARNRARRILREAWRYVSPQLSGDLDVVLVAREAIRGARTQDLVSELIELVRRMELKPA